jgi:hypothetical protein
VRHFCQLTKNCAFASSMLAARPLVVMPSMGLTYSGEAGNQAGTNGVAGRHDDRDRTGYLTEAKTGRWIFAPTIQELQATGCESLRAIAAGLEERGIPAARGGNWSAVQVARLLGAVGTPFGGSAAANTASVGAA